MHLVPKSASFLNYPVTVDRSMSCRKEEESAVARSSSRPAAQAVKLRLNLRARGATGKECKNSARSHMRNREMLHQNVLHFRCIHNQDDSNMLRSQVGRATDVTMVDRVFQVNMSGRNGCSGHTKHRRDREDHTDFPYSWRTRNCTQHPSLKISLPKQQPLPDHADFERVRPATL